MWRIVLISLRRATVEETSTSGNNAMPAVGVAEAALARGRERLDELPRAHELIQSGKSIGKIVCRAAPA